MQIKGYNGRELFYYSSIDRRWTKTTQVVDRTARAHLVKPYVTTIACYQTLENTVIVSPLSSLLLMEQER